MAHCAFSSCRGIGCTRVSKHAFFFLFSSFAWLTTNISNFINDYFDIESDIIGRPNAPLASGAITRDFAKNALIAEYLISFLLLAGTVFVMKSILVFVLGIIPLLCTYIYSVPPFKTKDRAAIGPITISIAYMSVIVGGWVLASELTVEAIKLSLFFTILMLGIGFSKDFMHIEADRGFCNTPPIAYGIRKTAVIAAISLTFPIIFVQFFIYMPSLATFLFITPLIFSITAVFFMINKPTAKNRNIVMSAFLVYLNAVCIVIFINLSNMMLALISSITVSCVMAVKTWMTGWSFVKLQPKSTDSLKR